MNKLAQILDLKIINFMSVKRTSLFRQSVTCGSRKFNFACLKQFSLIFAVYGKNGEIWKKELNISKIPLD